MKNGRTDQSSCMDEYQNSDISYGQLDHSVAILQSVIVVMEVEQDLDQLYVKCHEEIRHLKFEGLGVVWNMKGQFLFISKTNYVIVMYKIFLRSDDGLGKCRVNFCICIQICACTRVSDMNNFWLLIIVKF